MADVPLATLAAQISKLMDLIEAVDRKLCDQILAPDRKLDAATGGGKLTLALLLKQQDKVLREQAAMRAELRTHSAALPRFDSSVQGPAGEVRA